MGERGWEKERKGKGASVFVVRIGDVSSGRRALFFVAGLDSNLSKRQILCMLHKVGGIWLESVLKDPTQIGGL